MNKTDIEWCNLSWNAIKGKCPGVYAECAEFCYARKLYKRYGWNPEIRLDEKELNCHFPKKPSRIFVGSTFDLSFADKDWLLQIRDKIKLYPEHTFIFLTKNPVLYDSFAFPKNCWLGMTVYGPDREREDNKKYYMNYPKVELNRFNDFKMMDLPNLKFISFEPLLRDALGDEDLKGISWVIIGAMSQPFIEPRSEWVFNIMNKARTAGCEIFLKNNLYKSSYLRDQKNRLQEIPEAK